MSASPSRYSFAFISDSSSISPLETISRVGKLSLPRVFRALGTRERILVALITLVASGALLFWFGAIYIASTKTVPEAGGEYVEGLASQPRYINPILSQTSEADADLVQLIYGSLFAHDAEGKLIQRFTENYSVSEDGKTYTVSLKPGIKWHNGEEVTADDVLFTVQAIQDPAYKSPLRSNWSSVEVATVDRYTLTFTLKKAYFGFLENLTVGILPKHIWEGITPDNFLLADYNLAPIGSGPYRFYDSDRDSNGNILSYELRAFGEYVEGAPYVNKITFHFYPDETSLIDAYNRHEVMGMNSIMPENLSRVEERKSARIHELSIPRIFAVFFNTTKNAALAHDEVREALSRATDRQAIIDEVLAGKGMPAYSAFLPFMKGYADTGLPTFDPDYANRLLDENGWQRGEDGIRSKNGTPLAFELMTPEWPELSRTADVLKAQWERAGARVTVTVLGAVNLQQNAIRPREYQALLFGEAAMIDSDPYSFWHSSQKRDPGLNLALFDNKEADDVLSTAREEMDEGKRLEKYRSLQMILAKENPAVFLYSPTYLYVVGNVVQGIDLKNIDAPAYRFSDVRNWYIDTTRVRK